MMKSEINLLPSDVIEARVRRIYLQRAGRLHTVLMIGLVLLVLVYGGVGFMLRTLNTRLSGSEAGVDESSVEVQAQVRALNSTLGAMQRYVAEHDPWLGRVQEALLLLPDGMAINEIELQESVLPGGKREQFVRLSGASRARSDVVAYEKLLSELSWVEKVESPLKNLASGETVSFSFSLYRAAQ